MFNKEELYAKEIDWNYVSEVIEKDLEQRLDFVSSLTVVLENTQPYKIRLTGSVDFGCHLIGEESLHYTHTLKNASDDYNLKELHEAILSLIVEKAEEHFNDMKWFLRNYVKHLKREKEEGF